MERIPSLVWQMGCQQRLACTWPAGRVPRTKEQQYKNPAAWQYPPMQNNPAYRFFEYINGYPHIMRVYSRGNKLHLVETYVGQGEFHPTIICTTSTSHSDGLLSIWSEVSTPLGQQYLLSSYCPASSPLVPIPDCRWYIPSPAPAHHNIFLLIVTLEDSDIWRECLAHESAQVQERPQASYRTNQWTRRARNHPLTTQLPFCRGWSLRHHIHKQTRAQVQQSPP